MLGHGRDERRPRLERQREHDEALDVLRMKCSVHGGHKPAEATADESDAAHALALSYALDRVRELPLDIVMQSALRVCPDGGSQSVR